MGGGGGNGFPAGMIVPHHLQMGGGFGGGMQGGLGMGGGGEGAALEKSKLSQAAWFFKIIALEINRTAVPGGVSNGRRDGQAILGRAGGRQEEIGGGANQDCKRLLSFLFEGEHFFDGMSSSSLSSSALTTYGGGGGGGLDWSSSSSPQRMPILSLFEMVSAPIAEPMDEPRLLARIPDAERKKFSFKDRQGVNQYDIHLLHKYLRSQPEENGVGGGGEGVGGEEWKRVIKMTLETVVEINNQKAHLGARYDAVCGWKSMVEISLVKCLSTLSLLSQQRQPFHHSLLDLLSPLLTFLSSAGEKQLSTPISETVLLIITKIRELGLSGDRALPADRLVGVLRGLLNALIRTETSQMTRGYLYAALLNYLFLTSTPIRVHLGPEVGEEEAWYEEEEARDQQRMLRERNLRTIGECGSKLIHQLCVDAVNSPGVCNFIY